MPGETNQSLSLLRVKASQGGPYRVIVSNPIGSVTSFGGGINGECADGGSEYQRTTRESNHPGGRDSGALGWRYRQSSPEVP